MKPNLGHISYKWYEIEPSSPEPLSARLTGCAHALYNSHWKGNMHTHPNTELIYTLFGSGHIILKGERFSLQPDTLAIVHAGMPHFEYCDPGNNLEYIVLNIENLRFQFESGNQQYSVYNLHADREIFLPYLQQLLAEVQNKNIFYADVCQHLMACFLLCVSRKTNSAICSNPDQDTPQECRFIQQYLEEHYTEDITLQSLSEMTCLSKYYLAHTFKEHTGVSPIQYLIEYRIRMAAELLNTPGYSVAQIAYMVGFSSQSYFAQMFKRQMGLSPSSYRKKARG